jgi:outer membrane protein assembly factor BamB
MNASSPLVRQSALRLPIAILTLVVATGCGATQASAGSGSSPPAVLPHGAPSSEWTTYGQNGLRTGVDASGASFASATPAWTSPAFDGSLSGQPLVATGRVYAATENNTVYALSADSGGILWSHHIATPFRPSTVPGICGNISPTVGITSTPVIDTARGEIFVVAAEQGAGSASHHLFGLDLYTGAVLLDEVVDPPPSVVPNPAYQLQRASLALTTGRVVIGFGGNSGDCGSYHGLVVSAPEDGSAPSTFVVANLPGDSKGAVWMGGAAPVIDAQGDIWVSTGNSAHTSSNSAYDNSDSVLKLSPTASLLDHFAPSNWYADNATDADLGSTSPTLLPNGLVFTVGKSLTGYVLDQADLHGTGGQVASTGSFCGGEPFGGSAQWNGTVFVPCGDGLRAVVPTRSAPTTTWTSASGGHSSPIVAGGLVWSIGVSTLYALDPSTGHQVQSFDLGGQTTHFPSPAAADGLVIAPSSNQLHAFAGPAGLPGPPAPAPATPGYWLGASDGGIFSFGDAAFWGSAGALPLVRPIVGLAATPDRRGYWLVASDGGVFSYGDAGFFGSTGGLHLNRPIVGLAPTPDGQGYWLTAADGGVFAFGDATFAGSTGGLSLNAAVVGIDAGPDAHGYRLVAADGGIFAFGSAPFSGSAGSLHLVRPIVGSASAPATGGAGYWLVASDGGIFAFGAAGFHGSAGGLVLQAPIVGMAPTRDGQGYWLAGADAGVFTFGDATFSGSVAGVPLNAPVVGIAAGPTPPPA